MTTNNKDFKVKNGIVVSEGGTFGGPVTVGTPTDPSHAVTLDYLDGLSFSGVMTVSENPPESASSGDIWFDSTSGATFVYYDSYWIQIMSATGPQGEQGIQGETGPGLASGGTAGQIIAKVDSTDYNTTWIDNYTSDVRHLVKASESISKGQAVYISGANGTNILVSKASNSTENTSSKTFGVAIAELASNAQGYVISEGLVSGLNTSSATAGDPIWLGTSGNLLFGVANKPVAPAHLVYIGVVTRVHASNGEILVRIQNGFEIDELHNVLVSGLADKDILAYDNATGLWKNRTATDAGIQTRVANVSDTEIGYLDGVTSAIQTQLDGKVSKTGTNTISLTTTTDTDPLTIQSKNLHGGAGFAGFITFENTTTGATNTKKYLRMNSSGGIEIINSAYTANIFTLEDNGNLTGLNNVTANGTVSATNIGDSGWQTVSSFSNSYSGTNVAYRKINNVIYLRGRVNGGTAGAGAFTLPSGYRPSTSEVVIPVQQYGTSNINYVTVGTDGVVVPNGSSAWLHSVVFPVG